MRPILPHQSAPQDDDALLCGREWLPSPAGSGLHTGSLIELRRRRCGAGESRARGAALSRGDEDEDLAPE